MRSPADHDLIFINTQSRGMLFHKNQSSITILQSGRIRLLKSKAVTRRNDRDPEPVHEIRRPAMDINLPILLIIA